MPISDGIDTTAMAAWTADAYLGIGSQYIYRGVALRDDGPVPTAQLSVQHRSGWFANAWIGRVDGVDYYGYSPKREWLLDTNIGYGAQLSSAWQWSLSRAEIVDVDSGFYESHNYGEWRANLFYEDKIAVQFAYAENYRQLNWAAWNIEITGQHYLTRLNSDVLISGEWGVGHSHNAGFPEHDYNYEWLGLQTEWLHSHWQLRSFHTDNNARYVLDDDRVGNRIELTASWHFSLKR